ncbi:Transcriptional regulator, GntR family [[Actinomadura] parvosata subsp. kistnae]|uniref:GntR family transcriptional regulator n=1 Tax=[Actinomadura] parvosata subsp. kistnae TaxID=1909395 RepID=A0A1V0ABG2_9ACTN|nr:GntR family transcriptional regulator [Nonomuraea sp. ATCC 55076]AQZ67472.1 GntR family transcriptional regulator [Nonomuraea sp. ATCC 55076]SPL94274.1 Transcriptional regulator, GntR family [Actinomadura parvosata subsp. kistnae]
MKPVVRSPLRDQIRQTLLDGLISGRWGPGDRVVERQLAAEAGVSQAPVREALRELAALRLIEFSPNKGARVRELTQADLREVYVVRAGLEETAVRLRRPPIAALRTHLARMHAAGPVADQVRHGVAFHREIVRAAGNEVLLSVWESLGIEVWTHLSIRLFRTHALENAADHAHLLAAFERDDPGAGVLLREHVLSYAETP